MMSFQWRSSYIIINLCDDYLWHRPFLSTLWYFRGNIDRGILMPSNKIEPYGSHWISCQAYDRIIDENAQSFVFGDFRGIDNSLHLFEPNWTMKLVVNGRNSPKPLLFEQTALLLPVLNQHCLTNAWILVNQHQFILLAKSKRPTAVPGYILQLKLKDYLIYANESNAALHSTLTRQIKILWFVEVNCPWFTGSSVSDWAVSFY